MAEETVTMSVRIPRRLQDKIRKLAEAEHRSLNGQVVMMLTNATAPKMRTPKR
jgi:hypothetical protein